MKRFLLSLIIPLLLSCSVQEGNEEFCPSLIAHAGGAVDSCLYTNSREALELAFEKGYRFVELDLLFTSDSVLVAAHSWSKFNEMTGFSHKGDTAPSYNDFANRKICGSYTPLSAADINAFFEQNEDLYLVTDKVSDPEILHHHFPGLKNRMVVEAFSFRHYSQLKDEGYFRVLYSCMAEDLNSTLLNLDIADVEWFALHTTGFDNFMFRIFNTFCNFDIALFTVDDMNDIPKKFRSAVKMVYTNYIEP